MRRKRIPKGFRNYRGPKTRLARIYRPDGTEHILEEADQLLGEDVLPGFNCTLASILG